MFQSNKEYLEFLKQSGVHSFLQETPNNLFEDQQKQTCLLYTSPSPRDATLSRMPSSA